jgi:hypothetical protein
MYVCIVLLSTHLYIKAFYPLTILDLLSSDKNISQLINSFNIINLFTLKTHNVINISHMSNFSLKYLFS